MEKFCPKCGIKSSNSESLFCNRCGTRIPEPQPEKIGKICPNCGAEILDKASIFCPRCGSPISTATPIATKDDPLPKVNLNDKSSSKKEFNQRSSYRENIEEKSPFLSLLCSLFIPGLGQVYNGKTSRGIAFFVGTLVGLILVIPGIIIWLYGMYDAFSMAKKMNIGQIQFLPTKTAHLIIFFILAILIGVAGIAFIVGEYSALGTGSTTSQFSSWTPSQIQNQAQNISYTDLMRSPDAYKNTIVYYRGQILEVQNVYGNQYMLRIATKGQQYLGQSLGYTDDIIYVDYNGDNTGDRPVVGDIVDLWGNFVGLKTYTAVLGNQITIPEINKLYMTVYQPAP